MSIRGWMDENQNLVAVIAVVIIILAGFFAVRQCMGGGGPGNFGGDAYFYDTVTGTVFSGDANQIPPIQSPDGNEAVRVHYYSCGECNETDRFVGYYEKYTSQAKQRIEAAQGNPDEPPMMEMDGEGLLISLDAKQWMPQYSQQAEQAMSSKLQCPDGKRLRYCHAE